jgi:hypothetical protein
MFIDPICYKTLQAADGDRAIQFSSITFLFTRMVAYTTYGGGKGIIFFDHIEGFLISASLDQGNIALCTRLCRTGVFTGAGAPFGDQKGVGNGLRVRPVNRFSLIQSLIEFIRQEDRANLCTVITTRAFAHVHIAWMFSDLRFEMPRLSFQRDEF